MVQTGGYCCFCDKLVTCTTRVPAGGAEEDAAELKNEDEPWSAARIKQFCVVSTAH